MASATTTTPEEIAQFRAAAHAAAEKYHDSDSLGPTGLFFMAALPLEQRVAFMAGLTGLTIDEIVDALTMEDPVAKAELTGQILAKVKESMKQRQEQQQQEVENLRDKYATMLAGELEPDERTNIEKRLEILQISHPKQN